jgi:hypothetical protein
MTTYQFRKSLFEKEKTFVISDNAIIIKTALTSESISFKDVIKINLMHVPGFRNSPEQYICDIYSRDKGKTRFGNQSFKGFGSFENRYESYKKFVLKLHEILDKKTISYESGSNSYSIMLIVFSILLILIGGLSIVGFYLGKLTMGFVMLFGFLLFGFFIRNMLKSLKKSFYNPLDIPIELLP